MPASPGLLPASVQLRQQQHPSTSVLKPGRRSGERVTGSLTCGILHSNQQEPITAAGSVKVKLCEHSTKDTWGWGSAVCIVLGGVHLECEM